MKLPREIKRGRHRTKWRFHPQKARESCRHVADVVRSEKAEQVYQFRKYYGISRLKLAGQIGVLPETIQNWEFGDNEPRTIAWRAFVRIRLNYRRREKRNAS